MEKLEPSYTAGRNVKWYSCFEKVLHFLKKLELLYDPNIPLLGIYPRKMKTYVKKIPRTSMFTTALFIIAKNWKQPKCPSPNEWINKTCYCHTRILFGNKKK